MPPHNGQHPPHCNPLFFKLFSFAFALCPRTLQAGEVVRGGAARRWILWRSALVSGVSVAAVDA